MMAEGATVTRLPERTKRPPVISSAVLGTLFFIVAEVMFFSGAISAFTISRSGALPGTWPMPGQPRLPAEATGVQGEPAEGLPQPAAARTKKKLHSD